MSENSIIHRPLIPSGTNTPIDARCRVDRFDQIGDIENPYIGLHVYVVSTGKEYIVQMLLPKEIGGVSVPYGKIDILSLLEVVRDVDLEPYIKKDEANNAFVNKESGKGLSTNDFTNDEKSKLEEIEPKANVNVIERISLNGEEITPFEKRIALIDIQRTMRAGNGIAISDNTISCTIDTTLFKVVDSIPSGAPSEADKNKIHLVRNDQSSGDNLYDEYLWNGGKWEKLGEFKAEVDLTPYLSKEDAKAAYLSKTDAGKTYLSKIDAEATYIKQETGKGLSSNDYTTGEKEKLSGIEDGADVNVIEGVSVDNNPLSISGKRVNIDIATPIATAKTDAINAGRVSITESAGADSVMKVYTFMQNGSEIGRVNIPKDLVVSGGSIVEVDGVKYLRLAIANQSSPVDIPVSDLVDVYGGSTYINIGHDNTISVNLYALDSELAKETSEVGKAIKANRTEIEKIDLSVYYTKGDVDAKIADYEADVQSISADLDLLIDQKDSLGNAKAISLDTDEWPTMTGLPIMREGDGAPAVIPDFVGQKYADITNKKLYFAFGVSSVSDWVVMN